MTTPSWPLTRTQLVHARRHLWQAFEASLVEDSADAGRHLVEALADLRWALRYLPADSAVPAAPDPLD